MCNVSIGCAFMAAPGMFMSCIVNRALHRIANSSLFKRFLMMQCDVTQHVEYNIVNPLSSRQDKGMKHTP